LAALALELRRRLVDRLDVGVVRPPLVPQRNPDGLGDASQDADPADDPGRPQKILFFQAAPGGRAGRRVLTAAVRGEDRLNG